ncbi:MAG: hypothetical protein OEV59_06135 [Deltaproteobacteria bacterium]|nr:hypothetical protein [Deltaproteobacteria bacterium]
MKKHAVIIAILAMLILPGYSFGATARKKAAPKKPVATASADSKRLGAMEEKLNRLGIKAEETDKRLDAKIGENAKATEKLGTEVAAINSRFDERQGQGLPLWFFAAAIAGLVLGLFIIARYSRKLIMETVGREVERRLSEVKVSAELFTSDGGIETPAYVRRGGRLSEMPAVVLPDEAKEEKTTAATADQAQPDAKKADRERVADAGGAVYEDKDISAATGKESAYETELSPSEAVERGIEEHRSGNIGAAIECFSAAIAADKNFAAAFNHRGLAYAEAKNYTKAIEDYGNAILLDNKNAGTYLNIIELLTVVNEFRRAEDLLTKGKAFIRDAAERAEAACLECVLKRLTGVDTSKVEAEFDRALAAPFLPGEWSLRLLTAWAETSEACEAHRDYVMTMVERFKSKA